MVVGVVVTVIVNDVFAVAFLVVLLDFAHVIALVAAVVVFFLLLLLLLLLVVGTANVEVCTDDFDYNAKSGYKGRKGRDCKSVVLQSMLQVAIRPLNAPLSPSCSSLSRQPA